MSIVNALWSFRADRHRFHDRAALTLLRSNITPAQQEQFDADGYIVVEGLFSLAEMAAVRERLFDLIYGRVAIPDGVKFEQEPAAAGIKQIGDMPKYRQVWDLVPADSVVSSAVTLNPKLIAPLKGLIGANIKLFRVTAMLKPSKIGSDLPYHQDSAYWPIRPMSMVSCWLAVDDATKENGCMRVIPGLHKRGLLQFKTDVRGGITYQEMALTNYDLQSEVFLEMEIGSCLFFHSLLPHATGPNRTETNRFAIISSFMSAESNFSGPGRRPDYLLVCGKSFFGKV